MTTLTVDGVILDVLPASHITDAAEYEARAYAGARASTAAGWTLLHNAWLAGWLGRTLRDRALPKFAEAHAAGLAHRRATVLDAQAWEAAEAWAADIGLSDLVADGCKVRFVCGWKAARNRDRCPPGRSSYSGYRAAMDAHRTLAVVR